MRSVPGVKNTIHTKNKSQSTVMDTTMSKLNFGDKQKIQNQELFPQRCKIQSAQKEQKLEQKFLFYTNTYMKDHKYQQIKVSDFQKKYHIIDSPEVIFKIADIIHEKQNTVKGINFQQNWQQDLKKTMVRTVQSKFRQNQGQRKKFYNLMEDLRDQISKLDKNKNLSISQTFEYKQHVLNIYFYSLIEQTQKQCHQKAKLMQGIWSLNTSLMSVIFKTLVAKLNQNESKYLIEMQKTHSEYQKYLKQYFEQNKILKKDNREKSQFIENLVFNLRYKRKQIKHLNTSIGTATAKLNQYKDLYIQLENRHIQLQMEAKDISKQLSRFLIQRKKLLIQEKKKKFKLNQNKLKIKKVIIQQLKHESEIITRDLNKNLLQSYTRSRKEKGDKYLMIDDMDQFALKINDQDDYPFIIEDQDFGYVQKGINTDQIHFPLAQIGVQYDKQQIEQKSYLRNVSVQVNCINQFNYFDKLKDHLKKKFTLNQKMIDIQILTKCNIEMDKYKLVIKGQKSQSQISSANKYQNQERKKQKRKSKLQMPSISNNPNKRFRNSIAYFKKQKLELNNLAEIIQQEQKNIQNRNNSSANFKIKNKMSLTKSSSPDIDYLIRQGKKIQSQLDSRRQSSKSIFNNISNTIKNKNRMSKQIKKFPYKIIFDKRKSNSENFVIKLVDDNIKNEDKKDERKQIINQISQSRQIQQISNKLIVQSSGENDINLYLSAPLDNELNNTQSSKSYSIPFYKQIMKLDSVQQIYTQKENCSPKFQQNQFFTMFNFQDNLIQKDRKIRKQSIQCPENQYKMLEDQIQQSNQQMIQDYKKKFIKMEDQMDGTDIQQVLHKYLSSLKKRKRNDLINQKQFLKNSLIQLSKLLKNRPSRRDSVYFNQKNNNSKMQMLTKIINQIYDIGYKCIYKKDQLKSISECIYQSFRLSYGRLENHILEEKIVSFLNLVNGFKIKNHKIQFFALLCGMQEENPHTKIVCGLDFILFLKLYFHINQQGNNNSEINYTTIQKLNEGFYNILVQYVGHTQQKTIKKQLQNLFYGHTNSNQNNKLNLKINSEETIIFIFNHILKSRLVFHNQYQSFLNILKNDQFNIIEIQTFQFLVSCFQHKKIEYAHIIKNFTQECDLNYYNKKSMSHHKFSYFCLKYNFHTFQQIYDICLQNLKSRNLNQPTKFFKNQNNSIWLKQMEYMIKQLNRGNQQLIIQTKLFQYMTDCFARKLTQNLELIQKIYTMLWNKIFYYQSQRFLTFVIGKHFQLLYSYGFQVIHNTDI